MIVPFVFNISIYREAVYLWYFYKYLDFAKEKGWPIIAQEIYFNKSPSEFAAEGRNEALTKAFADKVYYNLPKNEDLDKILKYSIPDSIWHELADNLGSIIDASCFLIRERYDPLETLLLEYLDDISSKYEEKIEAIMVMIHNPSLISAANKKGIKVIHFEWGVFRQPIYLDTAYFTFDNLYDKNSVEIRWNNFLDEHNNRSMPVFTNFEILALFLKKDHIKELHKINNQPRYKIGAALGYSVYEPLQYNTKYSDAEMMFEIKNVFGGENLAVRRHPHDPYGSQYPFYKNRIEDPKYSTIDFILACESVASLGSNVSMEAMYWGRKANVKMPSPPWYASEHSYSKDGKLASSLFLSFYAFCYLIPFELLTDIEYIRWRLSEPSQRDIYFRHLSFFLEKKGFPNSLIFMDEGTRFDLMLKLQEL